MQTWAREDLRGPKLSPYADPRMNKSGKIRTPLGQN